MGTIYVPIFVSIFVLVHPTICDSAVIPLISDIDACLLQSSLAGKMNEHRDATISYMQNFRAIRTSYHKFIQNYNDRNEMHNLIDKEPMQSHQFGQMLAQRMKVGKWL